MPTWNLSLVLHQRTKAPFEPVQKASLKQLFYKAVFLLALGSGNRCSEIHAWLYKSIGHQGNWSRVSLYPSPTFRSKNQLGRKGLLCVALVVLPVLAPSLNKSLKEDKSLYPVRTLRYYLARTKDLCKGKNLAFRKSFIRILFQLPALPGARELCCNATSFLMSKPRAYIKSEPMVFKPLLLPRHSQGVSPWTKSSQPARGRSIILLRNFI